MTFGTGPIPITFKRDAAAKAAVKVELIVPAHMQGISAPALDVPTDSDTATLRLRFGPKPGPLNMPLIVRATSQRAGQPLVAEATLELVERH